MGRFPFGGVGSIGPVAFVWDGAGRFFCWFRMNSRRSAGVMEAGTFVLKVRKLVGSRDGFGGATLVVTARPMIGSWIRWDGCGWIIAGAQ